VPVTSDNGHCSDLASSHLLAWPGPPNAHFTQKGFTFSPLVHSQCLSPNTSPPFSSRRIHLFSVLLNSEVMFRIFFHFLSIQILTFFHKNDKFSGIYSRKTLISQSFLVEIETKFVGRKHTGGVHHFLSPFFIRVLSLSLAKEWIRFLGFGG
jgi:hypothetical protein